MDLPDLTRGGPLFDMHTALQTRLKTVFPPAIFEHQTVPARLTRDVWDKLVRRTPMVGLGWGGLRPEADAGRHLSGAALWTAFLVLKNAHSPLARLRGDAMGLGQLGMAQVACAVLQGFSIPDVGVVRVTDVANIAAENLAEENTAIVGVTFEVRFTLVPAPAAGDLQDFLRMQVQWQFDPAATGPLDMIEVRE